MTMDSQLSARFEREVIPLRASLYRRAYRMSRNHADAEDLLQDTMMRAHAGFETFRSDTNLKAWLFRNSHQHVHQRLPQTTTTTAPVLHRGGRRAILGNGLSSSHTRTGGSGFAAG